jgi:hypothetical protein
MSDAYDHYMERDDIQIAAPRSMINRVAAKDPKFRARAMGVPEDLIENGVGMEEVEEVEIEETPVDLDAPPEKTCAGMTAEGQPCLQTILVEGSDYCVRHDPVSKEEKAQKKRKKSSNTVYIPPDDVPVKDPETLDEIKGWQSWLIGALARGDVPTNVAQALHQNLSSLRVTLEKGDLAEQLAEIQKKMEEMGK